MAHVPIKKRRISSEHDIHKFQGKESILTSQIELYVEEAKPKIPDGGWGWVIVLSCFTLNAISEGVSFSFGLLFVEFLREFEASNSATSWVGSLFLAVPLLAGPIGSALVDRYGCISMTVLGSLVCTTGFILSTFVTSLTALYITFGVIGGIGRCLTFVTAVVSIAFWFENKRAIALGLAASGTGVGTIVFAPLTTLFIDQYAWRGTMLMLAGCFLNMCVCGVVMRDPKWIIEESREKKATKADKKRMNKSLNDGKNGKQSLETNRFLPRKDAENSFSETNKIHSAVDLSTYLKNHGKLPDVSITKYSTTNKHSEIIQTAEDTIPEEEDDENEVKSANHAVPLLSAKNESDAVDKPNTYLESISVKRISLNQRIIENSNNTNIKVSMSSPDMYTVYRNTVTSKPPKKIRKKWYVQFFNSVKGLLKFSLFLELHFLLLAISTTILFIWFIVPYFYIAKYMIQNGYTETQASFVLSAIGLTNTIGMVILGWAGERLNIAKTYAICLILCGASIACIILFSFNFTMLVLTCGLFGLFFASCFSLLPSLLGELIPLEDFTMAYGLILLCMGVGNLCGPPLAGYLFDLTGTWDLSFYQAAGWIVLSGILIGIIPYSRNRRIIGSRPVIGGII